MDRTTIATSQSGGWPGTSPQITAVFDEAFHSKTRYPVFPEDAKKGDIEGNPIAAGRVLPALYAGFLDAPATRAILAAVPNSE
jgi:hypothetical protein